MTERQRWSDGELERFHEEFKDHIADELPAHIQQKELYDAVFRLGDEKRGIQPGLLQTVALINEQLQEMRIWQDRQKTFVGGVMFAVSALGFFFTDAFHNILGFVKKL